jgi:hypothetical protein
MSTNVYNIVWADDEIDALMDRYEERFMDNGFRVIGKAHDGQELKAMLSEMSHKTDAVIIDANFLAASTDGELSERDIPGLDFAYSLFAFTYERSIPFFLFTQRSDEMLREQLVNKPDFFKDFKRHEHWFKKNDEDELDEMFGAIKQEVDYKRTDAFLIRNKYRKEFEASLLIDDAETNLEKGLLFLYEDNTWKDTQDYFNPARKIVERIIDSCIKMKLLPPHISLNTAAKILAGKTSDFNLTVPLIEKPLAESLEFFLRITQDGSHDKCDLQLGVDQYVRKVKNANLYLSILHIAMDLLLWHEELFKQYNGNMNRLWNGSFIHMGYVILHPKHNNVFYTGIYQLENKNGELKVGDYVGVKKGDPNKLAFLKPSITEYVYESNYIIL